MLNMHAMVKPSHFTNNTHLPISGANVTLVKNELSEIE